MHSTSVLISRKVFMLFPTLGLCINKTSFPQDVAQIVTAPLLVGRFFASVPQKTLHTGYHISPFRASILDRMNRCVIKF